MKVSVIVPVYNDSRIEACLASLLKQDYPHYEVIVVDNNSGPAIKAVVERFPSVMYLNETQQGAYAARNLGLRHASGEIAAFIDADCVADSAWLSHLVRGFADQQVGGIGGKILKLPPKTWVQRAAEDLAEQQVAPQVFPFFPKPYIVTANAAYRIAVLNKLGQFDTQFQSGGDVDMAWRVQQVGGYNILTDNEAIVYHAPRETLAAYFKQYFGYAVGHTLLFKKHRRVTNKSMFINTYPLLGLLITLYLPLPLNFMLLLCAVLLPNPQKGELLKLVKCIALVCGNIYGSIKYRVPFL